jgi:N-acetylglucosamine-6-phosphate deacetylase
MYKALTGATIYTGEDVVRGKILLINDDRIIEISESLSLPANCELTDLKGYNICPGLIDLQIAGGGGYLYSARPTADALEKIAKSIIATGTTSFLIVLPTNSFEIYRKAVEAIKSNPHPAVAGLHLEGPWISMAKRGAHMAGLIRKPDLKDIEDLLRTSEGIIKMITVAPEVCSPEEIELMKSYGVVVCAGHSNATFGEAVKGFKSGITSVTHLFNAMSMLHHRDPGLPGAAFETENISASVIADGIHVDYNMISIAKKVMKERIFLVSDAVEVNDNGVYNHIRKADRFVLPDGTLSGSALTMMMAVKNCVEHVGIPAEEAIRMATVYPAKLMGFNDIGKISPGLKADLVVFNNDYDIKMVFKNGILQ